MTDLITKGDGMLEICISGFFILSVAISLLLWRTLAVAKQADDNLGSPHHSYRLETMPEQPPVMKLVPSGND